MSNKAPREDFKSKFDAFFIWYITPAEDRLPDERTGPDYRSKYKIPERTYYNWIHTQLFKDYMKEYFSKNQELRIGRIRQAMFQKALDGDVQAAKLFYQYDARLSDKIDLELEGNLKVDGKVEAQVSLKALVEACADEESK